MNRKWINEKDFATNIVIRYTIMVCESLLRLPEGNLSCFSVLPYIAKF